MKEEECIIIIKYKGNTKNNKFDNDNNIYKKSTYNKL